MMRIALLLLLAGVHTVYMKSYIVETKDEHAKKNAYWKERDGYDYKDDIYSADRKEKNADWKDPKGSGEWTADKKEKNADWKNADWKNPKGSGEWTSPATPISTSTWKPSSTTTKKPCTFGDWSAWKSDKSCGSTVKRRSRECKAGYKKCAVSECQGSANENEQIRLKPCCAWGKWTGWSERNEDKCIKSQVYKYRKCQAVVPGTKCENRCRGQSKLTKIIPADNCCKWTGWEEDPCNVTCGPGQQTSKRQCKYKDIVCPASKCTGGASKTEGCELKKCPDPGTGGTDPVWNSKEW
jgi:hypothetical protein